MYTWTYSHALQDLPFRLQWLSPIELLLHEMIKYTPFRWHRSFSKLTSTCYLVTGQIWWKYRYNKAIDLTFIGVFLSLSDLYCVKTMQRFLELHTWNATPAFIASHIKVSNIFDKAILTNDNAHHLTVEVPISIYIYYWTCNALVYLIDGLIGHKSKRRQIQNGVNQNGDKPKHRHSKTATTSETATR